MGRCNNNELVPAVTFNKLDSDFQVFFNILSDIPNCARINTVNYISSTAATTNYDAFTKPEDRFNCEAIGCRNTGTLMLTGAGNATLSATFNLAYDATEFYGGVITYYVYVSEPGSYTTTIKISDIRSANQANSDTYTTTITAEEAGFYPVVIDLTKLPHSSTGNGWEATETGVTVTITVAQPNGSASTTLSVGLSTIYFYDTMSDLEVNDTIVLRCVEDFSGDLTVDALDATCSRGGYDNTSIGYEKTLTFKKITENWWKLNPLAALSDNTEGWYHQTDARTVQCQSITVGGEDINFGYIQIPDYQNAECGFVFVSFEDCNVTDSALTRVSVPTIVELDKMQYMISDGTTTEALDSGLILFNEYMVGRKVIISYPKKANVTEWILSERTLYERRVRMSYNITQDDGKTIHKIHDNVLVTSWPESLTTDETSMDLTISVQRDKDGNWGRYQRVNDY